MSLQFEDGIDMIQAIHPEFDSIWMCDHSCGHDHWWEDGLNVTNMQVMWGGKQSKVRFTEIKEEACFLGPHSPQLKVGDIQYNSSRKWGSRGVGGEAKRNQTSFGGARFVGSKCDLYFQGKKKIQIMRQCCLQCCACWLYRFSQWKDLLDVFGWMAWNRIWSLD